MSLKKKLAFVILAALTIGCAIGRKSAEIRPHFNQAGHGQRAWNYVTEHNNSEYDVPQPYRRHDPNRRRQRRDIWTGERIPWNQ